MFPLTRWVLAGVGAAKTGPARGLPAHAFWGSPAWACGRIFASSVTVWQCDLFPCALCLAVAQKPALVLRIGGGIVPGQLPEACDSGEWPTSGTRSRTADLSPFNHSVLRRFMLFSGHLLNFILKICLHSLQNRFLIALFPEKKKKMLSKISLQETSVLNGGSGFPFIAQGAHSGRGEEAPGQAAPCGAAGFCVLASFSYFRVFCYGSQVICGKERTWASLFFWVWGSGPNWLLPGWVSSRNSFLLSELYV